MACILWVHVAVLISCPVIFKECGGLYDIVVDMMYKLHASKLCFFVLLLLVDIVWFHKN